MKLQDIQVNRHKVSSENAASNIIRTTIDDIINGGNPIQVISYDIENIDGDIAILCKMNESCSIFGKQLVLYYGSEGICCYTTNITMYLSDELCMYILDQINEEMTKHEDDSDVVKLETTIDIISDFAASLDIIDGELVIELN